jgi:hypothetical protein
MALHNESKAEDLAVEAPADQMAALDAKSAPDVVN